MKDPKATLSFGVTSVSMPIATLYHSETSKDAKYLLAGLKAQGCNATIEAQRKADANHDVQYTQILKDLRYYKITIEKVIFPNPEEK